MRLHLIFGLLLIVCGSVVAQTSREEMAADLNKTAGVYYAYPAETADNTLAPKGYKPFYIGHYGRHGSRYLISDNDYRWVADLLHKANDAGALTPLGRDVMSRLDSVMIEVAGRGGDLSPMGVRQHKGIADRMYRNYPDVFKGDARISARSTLVVRCVLSMASFCESLKEKNPRLDITMESSQRYMPYLCYSTPESNRFNDRKQWLHEVLRKFKASHTNPERLTSSIFADPVFVERYVVPFDFMWGMYWIAADAQNTENRISFYDIFLPEELFDLWQCFNAEFYAHHANYPPAEGKHLDNAKPLLRNFIESAEAAINGSGDAATLRFGHDGNVVPFVALLGFDGCDGAEENPDEFYKTWCDWRVSPMCANIQMILFRSDKKDSDIIVKFLHNEKETHIPVQTDIWPYYRWNDVKEYYRALFPATIDN